MLDGITPRTIKDFDIYLKNVRRLAPVTCGMHMAHLKAIINQAIRDKKVSYDTHPFEYYERPAGMPKERDISVADVKKIRDAEIKKKSQRVARDVFMLYVLSRRYQSDGLDAIQFQRCENYGICT